MKKNRINGFIEIQQKLSLKKKRLVPTNWICLKKKCHIIIRIVYLIQECHSLKKIYTFQKIYKKFRNKEKEKIYKKLKYPCLEARRSYVFSKIFIYQENKLVGTIIEKKEKKEEIM